MTDRLTNPARRDAVDALLRDVRVTSTLYCRSILTAPWGFGVQARQLAAFHLVASGGCWLEVGAPGEAIELRPGDLVILPRGDTHWLRDDLESPMLWLEDLVAAHPVDSELRLKGGGGGLAPELLCGAFAIEGSERHPLFSALPAAIRIHGDGERALPWLAMTVELIRVRVADSAAGSAVVLERLSEALLTQALRAALAEPGLDETLNAEVLSDRGIGPAVRAIHDDPEHAWTLGELSRLATMSRSAFAARFRALTGDSPIRYASRCRLARAAHRLRTTDATLAEIARGAGYESEFSFSRAFRRLFGVAPGLYRHRGDADAAMEALRGGRAR